MTFIEFLGFIISLASMIFLVAKRFWDENQRRRYPEKYAEKQRKKDQFMSEIMRTLDGPEKTKSRNLHDDGDEFDSDEEEEVKRPYTPPPPPKPLKETTRQSFDKMQLKSSFNDHYGESKNENTFLKSSMSDSYHEGMVSNKFLKGEASAYDLNKQQQAPSRASKILNDLPSLKNMLIIKEVFGPPKCMRINPWDE